MPGSQNSVGPYKPPRLPSLGRQSAGKNLPAIDHERKLRSIIGLCDDTTTTGSALGENHDQEAEALKPRKMGSQSVVGTR